LTNDCFFVQFITAVRQIKARKALVWPVAMYGCESWTLKNADDERSYAFKTRSSADAPRLRNDIYCVEWDVKSYYTILSADADKPSRLL